MIRIAIVDDQMIIRQGLSMLLGSEKDIEVVGTGENGYSAIELCRRGNIDVVLMDIKMPEMNGVDATKKIKEMYSSVQIIILTTFNEDSFIFDAIRNGASGYLLKDSPPAKIAEGIRSVYNGGALIQPDVAVKILDLIRDNVIGGFQKKDERLDDLTERELDIIKLVALGKNNREISMDLYISEGTVKNHLTNILGKLSLRDRTQLAVFAVKNGIV